MEVSHGPLARSTDLIIEELRQEVLVYDTRADRGHCLSAEAARVWSRCDGKTPAEGLGAQLGLGVDRVERALDELDGCELLEERPAPAQGTTRRELTVKMVKVGGAVAAAPLILSVAAPAAQAAVTPGFCNQFSSQDCGTGDPSEGCKSQVGCCCCNPPSGCPGTPMEHPGCKTCVPIGAPCPPAATGAPAFC